MIYLENAYLAEAKVLLKGEVTRLDMAIALLIFHFPTWMRLTGFPDFVPLEA